MYVYIYIYINELLFLGKTISHKIIQFHELTGCDTTSYFYGVEKIKPFQKIMKNKNVIELILNLKRLVSDNDDAITNCKIFIQLYFTIEHRRKQGCNCTISKKQLNITSSRSPVIQTSYLSSELSVIPLAAMYRYN